LREEHRLRVFETSFKEDIWTSKEDRSWRELLNDDLHSLYSSTNIVRVIKAGRLRWVDHVARMGKRCLGDMT
jgi:hypothetical protein